MRRDTRGAFPPAGKDVLFHAVDPIWKSVDIYSTAERYLRQSAEVGEAQLLLFAARLCDSEVCNGGLHQFFSNPSGVVAPEAVLGFRRLGLDAAADLVTKAIAQFGDPFPRDRDERCGKLSHLEKPGKTRAERDPFYEMDSVYYRVCPSSGEHAERHVREHRADFFRN
jgi:hypothetical protein